MIWNENGPTEPNKTEIRICVETEITDEEHLIIDELKVLMMRTEKKSIYISRVSRVSSRPKEIERCN